MSRDFIHARSSDGITLQDEGHPSRHEAGFGRILGTSEPMRELYSALERVGPTGDPVLIVGDRGTGKKLIARTLHAMSSRPKAPFIALPCAAIPDSLLEAELFGHEEDQGADGVGCLELASGGTLFLEEPSSIPLSIQGKLLDALKNRSFRRLGGARDVSIELRVVAASTVEPESAVVDGKLRHDLFVFLSGVTLHVPRLEERPGDIPLLATEFARGLSLGEGKRAREIEPDTMAALRRYTWPGNVRELWKVIERAVLREQGSSLRKSSLPSLGSDEGEGPYEPDEPVELVEPVDGVDEGEPIAEVGMTVDDVTRRLILRTLEATNFNRTKAAEILGISSKTVYNKLKQWNVHGPETPDSGDGRSEDARLHSADSGARLP